MESEEIIEVCPHCEQEVLLKNPKKKHYQKCPNCGMRILPCSLCFETGEDNNCDHCWNRFSIPEGEALINPDDLPVLYKKSKSELIKLCLIAAVYDKDERNILFNENCRGLSGEFER